MNLTAETRRCCQRNREISGKIPLLGWNSVGAIRCQVGKRSPREVSQHGEEHNHHKNAPDKPRWQLPAPESGEPGGRCQPEKIPEGQRGQGGDQKHVMSEGGEKVAIGEGVEGSGAPATGAVEIRQFMKRAGGEERRFARRVYAHQPESAQKQECKNKLCKSNGH